MNQKREYFGGPERRSERGQALILAVVWIFFVIAMAAVVVDLGSVYVSYRQLQASTDAAALAGGQDLPSANFTAATTDANNYGATTSGGNPWEENVYANMSNVTTTSTPQCSNTLKTMGLPCTASSVYNAISVKQQATVPLRFLNFFSAALGGVHPSMTIATTSMASGRLQNGGPYNIVIILDTTDSMQDGDGDASNNPDCSGLSKIQCAQQGVQAFLENIQPCYTIPCTSTGTDTNGNYGSNSLNEVALMVFPGFVTSGSVVSTEIPGLTGTYPWEVLDEFNYNITTTPHTGSQMITSANISPYTLYTAGISATSETIEQYEIVPFSSDYWDSSATIAPALLNTSSNLVKAVWYPPYYVCNGGSCVKPVPNVPPWGLADKGGEGTFYAGVITAAQEALVAEQTARNNGSQNVIILLSDGDATASGSQLNGYSTAKECTQAVTAAHAASTAIPPTTVYAVAYGAESSGCTSGDTYNPCSTMKAIASAQKDFFSDDTTSGSGAGCVGTTLNSTNLKAIFAFIASNFKNSRLLPTGTQ